MHPVNATTILRHCAGLSRKGIPARGVHLVGMGNNKRCIVY
ncbi:hypothetical protein [Caudoviricetes sp.]|nr:hypothetical protein [Caudoviricetes sp.]